MAFGFLSRLKEGLARSTQKLQSGLSQIISRRRLDEEALAELEEVLLLSDLGPAAAARIIADFRRTRFGRDVSEAEIRAALAGEIAAILAPVALPLRPAPPRPGAPFVVLVVGVNGTGKTTTIGKLAALWREEGHRPLLVAGDTFRAAAVEQLLIWGERAGVPVVSGATGADAAGLAFEAWGRAAAEGHDVLLIDTAGRLHNKQALMDELAKIVRVLKKRDETAPHATLLVLDATTGQNALEQVRVFKEMVDVTGLIVTKLDGSARGGVVVALAEAFGLPVHAVGVGERLEDLRPFDAAAFAAGLVGSDAAD